MPGHPTDILTAKRPHRQQAGKPVIYPRQQVPEMADVTDYGPGQDPFYPASTVYPVSTAAAARAASGSAAAMTAMASSSWAADRNHASNGDGGRYTPRSSIA